MLDAFKKRQWIIGSIFQHFILTLQPTRFEAFILEKFLIKWVDSYSNSLWNHLIYILWSSIVVGHSGQNYYFFCISKPMIKKMRTSQSTTPHFKEIEIDEPRTKHSLYTSKARHVYLFIFREMILYFPLELWLHI